MSESVRPIRLHDPRRTRLPQDLDILFFSPSTKATPFRRWLIDSVWTDALVPPGERRTLEARIRPGLYALFVPGMHAFTFFDARDGGPTEVAVDLLDGQLIPPKGPLGLGDARITVHNRSAHHAPTGFMFLGGEHDVHPSPQFTIMPYLTGKHLLTSQTFRELFRAETVPGEGGIEIRSLSILFTDLHASTALYERVGDLRALEIVRAHFDVLGDLVSRNRGAVVKTIGDAVMAVFGEAQSAMSAAFRMNRAIAGLSPDDELVLKIGVHAGACVAITSNNDLDYFGRTVNVAARVQQIARRGEVVCTDAVWASPGVAALTRDLNLLPVPDSVNLKGIAERMGVVRLREATRS